MFDRWKHGTSSREVKEEEGVILPYRRLGMDISFPNLAEGTCREASCTYHGKSCGHFPRERWWEAMEGGMKISQVRRYQD